MRERTICRSQMMNDLMKVYREVVADCPMKTTQEEVYDMVVHHPAPRYYVDPRRAHLVISPMMRGDRSELNKLIPLKRKMYEDLFETVLMVSQKKSCWGKKLYYLLREAVLEPAPRFYIDRKRMGQIWREKTMESRKTKYKKIGKSYEEKH